MNLFEVLPELPTNDFSNILPSLERHRITISDLLILEATDVARRAQVPAREIVRLKDALLRELQRQYGLPLKNGPSGGVAEAATESAVLAAPLAQSGNDLVGQWQTISTLDKTLDDALGGGIPTGYLTEITGESGAGKTQFLLTLLLSVQLAPTSRSALYITTESPLQTTRLTQIITSHPSIADLPNAIKPSLNRILSISTPDLESQDHILRYQVPVAIKRHNVGLLVIDSVTANYRAELTGGGDGVMTKSNGSGQTRVEKSGSVMARRSAQLTELGSLLREYARVHDIAVVVANQVADRFLPDTRPSQPYQNQQQPPPPMSSHPLPPSLSSIENHGEMYAPHAPFSQPAPQNPSSTSFQSQPQKHLHDPLTLNHQQNFFTGWGDAPLPFSTYGNHGHDLKTPSLGLVWTNQLAARITLIKSPNYGGGGRSGPGPQSKWRRHMKLVFAPWAPPSDGKGTEFEIIQGGVTAVIKDKDRVGRTAQEGVPQPVDS